MRRRFLVNRIYNNLYTPDLLYNFDPAEWSITEGVVSDAVALTNTTNFNAALDFAKNNGYGGMNIDNFDCFFQVRCDDNGFNPSTAQVHEKALKIPDQFHLHMTNNTHLRVQPNDTPKYALLSLLDTDDSIIQSGNLYGDRDDHTYQTGTGRDTHEWGHVTHIIGAHRTHVLNTFITDATGDAIYLAGRGNRNADGSLNDRVAEDTYIKNCTLSYSRRNNSSPVDAINTTFDTCSIDHAGATKNSIDGVLPKSGIDLEAYWEYDGSGNQQYFQKVEGVVIKDCTFTNSENADIITYTCNDVQIFRNSFTKAVSNTTAWNVSIFDNTFSSSINNNKAINIKSKIQPISGVEQNYNYSIYNNTITGFKDAITIGGLNQSVYNNNILECERAVLWDVSLVDSVFTTNSIVSSFATSRGYYANTAVNLDNVSILGCSINVVGKGLHQENNTTNSTDSLVVDGINITGGTGVLLNNTINMTVRNSNWVGSLSDTNNTNLTLENNNI